MHSRQLLADDFRRLGVLPGASVMLHASLRAVGEVAGGPDQIHLALKDVLGPEGTLVMYAGCPRYFDEVGRGGLTREEEDELLRTWPGSRVNRHVTRFVFWGRHAERLMVPQPWSYAMGAGSALDRLVQLDGQVLLLGADHDTVTFLHYAEHIVDIPGKRIARYRVPIDEDGRRVWREQEEFDTSDQGAHPSWPDRFFAKITDGYLARAGNGGGFVGKAQSHLFPMPLESCGPSQPTRVRPAGSKSFGSDGALRVLRYSEIGAEQR